MTDIQTIKDFLKADLIREHEHWHYYTNAALSIRGPRHAELKEFFLKEAADEMKHIQQFGEWLTCGPFETVLNLPVSLHVTTGLKEDVMLDHIHQMEEQAAQAYHDQLKLLENVDNSVPEYVVQLLKLFLEEQMQDSYQTALYVKKL